jgi:hypothetical protein
VFCSLYVTQQDVACISAEILEELIPQGLGFEMHNSFQRRSSRASDDVLRSLSNFSDLPNTTAPAYLIFLD